MSQKIILNGEDRISCPHCEQAFPLHEGLSHHLIDKYEQEYDEMLSKEKIALEEERRITDLQERWKEERKKEQEQLAQKQKLDESKRAAKQKLADDAAKLLHKQAKAKQDADRTLQEEKHRTEERKRFGSGEAEVAG